MKYFSVEAQVITPKQISFECPVCWSKYKKNGEPYKTAKRIRHIHGNDTGKDMDRKTTRSPHCLRSGDFDEFLIEITENTVRKGF